MFSVKVKALVCLFVGVIFLQMHLNATEGFWNSRDSSAAVIKKPVVRTPFKIRNKPYVDTVYQSVVLRNSHSSFGRKMLMCSGLVMGYQAISLAILYASPYSFSKWQRPTANSHRENMRIAFTKPPVVDDDYWYINYVGHPYQGACTYNAVRSQGSKFWQAGLFSLGHSLVWEYLIESGNERPSVQDIIVTPVAGSLLGELIHQATMRMARNGYTWYEGIFVTVFNPMFAINNGFRFAGKPVKKSIKTSAKDSGRQ